MQVFYLCFICPKFPFVSFFDILSSKVQNSTFKFLIILSAWPFKELFLISFFLEEEFWTFNSIHPCLKDIRNFKLDFFSKLLGWRPLLHSAEISVHLGKLLPILNYSDILSCRRLSRLIIFFKWHWESR